MSPQNNSSIIILIPVVDDIKLLTLRKMYNVRLFLGGICELRCAHITISKSEVPKYTPSNLC
jgi:hypothetical protein